MYFESTITINPSQVTKIEKIKPTKVFKKLLYFLTAGEVSEKFERETFTAISILQQLNRALITTGITNIIRLSHDDIDFYLDEEGKKDDLKEAFDLYDLKIDSSMSSQFGNLALVLEHEDSAFKYLIEIDINRDHDIAEHPISIKVSGLLNDFSKANESEMETIFSSQSVYDEFKRNKHHQFTRIIDELVLNIKRSIKCDEVEVDHKTKIVVKTKGESKPIDQQSYRESGIHYGYYGFSDALLYTYMWSSIGHSHPIIFNDAHYETETGGDLGHAEELSSSDSYFDGEGETLEPLSQPEPVDTSYDSGSDSSSSDGGWFDFSSDSDSSDSSSSCSSCSSCLSCSSCGGD